MLFCCFGGHKMELGSYNQFSYKNCRVSMTNIRSRCSFAHSHPKCRPSGASNAVLLNPLPAWPCLLLSSICEAEEHVLRICCFNVNCVSVLWRDSLARYISLYLKYVCSWLRNEFQLCCSMMLCSGLFSV